MTDISPEIYEKIKERYDGLVASDKDMTLITDWIREGKAHYSQAEVYAERSGKYLSQAMREVIRLEDLPDNTLYYNIAEKTIGRALEDNYKLMAEAARVAQENMNKEAGIGLKAAVPEMNRDRIHRIVDTAAGADTQEKLDAALGEPVKTYSRTVIDDAKRANARLHDEAGLEVRVEREYDGVGLHNGTDVCEWCKEREGSFTYEEAIRIGVFARHDGCGCIINYTSKKGTRTRSTDKWSWHDVIEDPKGKEAELITGEAKGNITKEYLAKATPGEGSIIKQPGFTDKGHEEEINFAEWLKETLGGEIIHNADSDIKGKHYADFTWNGKLWELKTIASSKYNTFDQHIRDANKQVASNRGGFMIDVTNNTLKRSAILSFIHRSMKNRNVEKTDVMIKDSDGFEVFEIE